MYEEEREEEDYKVALWSLAWSSVAHVRFRFFFYLFIYLLNTRDRGGGGEGGGKALIFEVGTISIG